MNQQQRDLFRKMSSQTDVVEKPVMPQPVSMLPTPRTEQDETTDAIVSDTLEDPEGRDIRDVDFLGKAVERAPAIDNRPMSQVMEEIENQAESEGRQRYLFFQDTIDQEIQEKVINKLPEGGLKTFANVVGPQTFQFAMDTLTNLQEGIGITTDTIESGLIKLEQNNPATYDFLMEATGGKRDPSTAAAQLTRDIGDMISISEAPVKLIPLIPNATLPYRVSKSLQRQEKMMERRRDPSQISPATVQEARMSESVSKGIIDDSNAKIASENRDLKNKLIRDFEANTGYTISKQVGKEGNLEIDPVKVREAGKQVAMQEELFPGADPTGKVKESAFNLVANPNKIDAFVALAKDFADKNPDAFPKQSTRPLIDQMADVLIAVDNKGRRLLPSKEYLETINKYGLSHEEFGLAVLSAGSDYGKGLQKFSQIRKSRRGKIGDNSRDEEFLLNQQIQENLSFVHSLWVRSEGIRRGILVSALKTAFRNFEAHAFVRGPLEALGNVLDQALYTMGEKGKLAGLKELGNFTNWKDSFASYKYIFSNQPEAKELVDYIFKRPELMTKYQRMFDIFSDIQTVRRGKVPENSLAATAFDASFAELEGMVNFALVPNRLQEFMIRRATALGELQRLVKQEYKIDLLPALREGKIQQLLNDDPSLVPEGKSSFVDLAERAVLRSLDETYAKPPDIKAFRDVTNLMVNSGATIVYPFPRFMFNKLELLGQYMGGSSLPLMKRLFIHINAGKDSNKFYKKLTDVVTSAMNKEQVKKAVDKLVDVEYDRLLEKGLNAKDRQRISRNVLGLAAIGAFYALNSDWIGEEEALSDRGDVLQFGNYELDVAPLSPLPDLALSGRFLKELIEGDNIADFLTIQGGAKQIIETITGSGTGRSYLSVVEPFLTQTFSIIQSLRGSQDPSAMSGPEAAMVSKALSNYFTGYLQYFVQFFQADRLYSTTPLGKLDTRYNPLPQEGTLGKEMRRRLSTRFGTQDLMRQAQKRTEIDPEETMPTMREPSFKVDLFSEKTTRAQEAVNLIFGLNIKKTSPMGRFFRSYGFNDFKLKRSSSLPSIAQVQEKQLKNSMADLYLEAKAYEELVAKEYKETEGISRKGYMFKQVRELIRDRLRFIRKRVNESVKQRMLASEDPHVKFQLVLDKFRRTGTREDRQAAVQRYMVNNNGRSPIFNDDDDPTDLLIIIDDITKRKKAFRKSN